VSVDRRQKASSRSASRASSGNSIRKTGTHLDLTETIFQNVYTDIDRKTGRATYRADILEQKLDQWILACPSTEGGHNWQAMTYHPGTQSLVIPLAQSCMEIAPRKVEQVAGQGGTAPAPRFCEMPGSDGNIGNSPPTT
jgi:alcohol dehydrogenase (cytochrome c)